MNSTTEIKTANQLYKESGSTLPFRQWIEREKAKGIFIPNVNANEEMKNVVGDGGLDKKEDNKPSPLMRNVAILVVISVLGYFAFKTIKNKANG